MCPRCRLPRSRSWRFPAADAVLRLAIAPGEAIAQQYYFKRSHIELVLGAAGLTDSPINQSPDAVAALIERTARSMHAPYETEPEIRAAAKVEDDKILAKVEATNQAAGL